MSTTKPKRIWFVIKTVLVDMPCVVKTFDTREEAVSWVKENETMPEGRPSFIIVTARVPHNQWGRVYV